MCNLSCIIECYHKKTLSYLRSRIKKNIENVIMQYAHYLLCLHPAHGAYQGVSFSISIFPQQFMELKMRKLPSCVRVCDLQSLCSRKNARPALCLICVFVPYLGDKTCTRQHRDARARPLLPSEFNIARIERVFHCKH